eukprot:12276336-Alexandrium_andersonii.AAC.1
MLRYTFKDMSMKPGKYLDETEQHDVRRLSDSERWQLAIRTLQRITLKQERAGLNVLGTEW